MRPAVGGTLPVLALVEGDEEEEDLSAEEKRLSAPLTSFGIWATIPRHHLGYWQLLSAIATQTDHDSQTVTDCVTSK